MSIQKISRVIVWGIFMLLTGCNLNYHPVFFPVEFQYDTRSRMVTYNASAELVTPLGTFEISTGISDINLAKNDMLVIIRDRTLGLDDVYIVHNNSDERLKVVTSGKTEISIDRNQVIVDVTNGSITEISFQVIKKEDISWVNAPFGYSPFMFTNYVFDKAGSLFEAGFVFGFCPGFVVGLILYLLSPALVAVELILSIILGLGLLLGPISVHLRNLYYILVLLVLPLLGIRKYSQ